MIIIFMYMKRGMSTMPFMFMFAMIVVAFVLFFGFKFVGDLKVRGEFLILSETINDLKDETNRYYSFDPGATKTLRLDLPKQVDEICFVDHDSFIEDGENKKVFESLESKNVFILPFDAFKITQFNIARLKPDQNPLCVRNIGKVEIVIVNKGKFVGISKK